MEPFIIISHVAPHKFLKSHNFTPHCFNIYFLIEFKFYFIIKPSIRILIYHIFFNIRIQGNVHFTHLWFYPFTHYLPVVLILTLYSPEVLFFNYSYKNLTAVKQKQNKRKKLKNKKTKKKQPALLLSHAQKNPQPHRKYFQSTLTRPDAGNSPHQNSHLLTGTLSLTRFPLLPLSHFLGGRSFHFKPINYMQRPQQNPTSQGWLRQFDQPPPFLSGTFPYTVMSSFFTMFFLFYFFFKFSVFLS